MNKKIYLILNLLILGLFLLTFFFQIYPYLLPKENILSGEPTLLNRLTFTSGLIEIKNDSPTTFILMNCPFLLSFITNKLWYENNKR